MLFWAFFWCTLSLQPDEFIWTLPLVLVCVCRCQTNSIALMLGPFTPHPSYFLWGMYPSPSFRLTLTYSSSIFT